MTSRLVLDVILAITLGTATGVYPPYAWINPDQEPSTKAPLAISGENV